MLENNPVVQNCGIVNELNILKLHEHLGLFYTHKRGSLRTLGQLVATATKSYLQRNSALPSWYITDALKSFCETYAHPQVHERHIVKVEEKIRGIIRVRTNPALAKICSRLPLEEAIQRSGHLDSKFSLRYVNRPGKRRSNQQFHRSTVFFENRTELYKFIQDRLRPDPHDSTAIQFRLYMSPIVY